MSQNIYRHQNKQVLLDDKPWQIRMIRLHQPLEYGRKHKYLLFLKKIGPVHPQYRRELWFVRSFVICLEESPDGIRRLQVVL